MSIQLMFTANTQATAAGPVDIEIPILAHIEGQEEVDTLMELPLKISVG